MRPRRKGGRGNTTQPVLSPNSRTPLTPSLHCLSQRSVFLWPTSHFCKNFNSLPNYKNWKTSHKTLDFGLLQKKKKKYQDLQGLWGRDRVESHFPMGMCPSFCHNPHPSSQWFLLDQNRSQLPGVVTWPPVLSLPKEILVLHTQA